MGQKLVHHADVRAYLLGVRGYVIQTFDHRGVGATARGIEHFDGIDFGLGSDPNDADTVISCSDDSGDMVPCRLSSWADPPTPNDENASTTGATTPALHSAGS